ncbi:hypothetical protein EGW08_020650 [Elysia chlorotica]|uniref:AIG1-type G domain-containing protein n=1 Tax=Elysia chlorotica TaxID=188477 RepID=A0A433SQQ6_ELYCH|nr:hypothetical protein EGW08_020650 [Elysia chlorotica]
MAAINVHLVGKQGAGKSATGNFILNRKAFRSTLSSDAVTIEFQTESVSYSSRLLRIWDGPGATDNSKQTAGIVRNMQDSVKELKAELHTLLWVIRYGEPCGVEDEILLKELTKCFGQKFIKANLVVVVTHKDNFDSDVGNSGLTFNTWVGNQTGFFKKLCQLCEYKVVPVNNKAKSDEQIQMLLPYLLKTSGTFEIFNLDNEDEQPSTTQLTSPKSSTTRKLPMPQISGMDKQAPTKPTYSKQTSQRDDDRGNPKLISQIEELVEILSENTQHAKLASLEKIRNELKAGNLHENGQVLEVVRREVEREIVSCQSNISQDQQTKEHLCRLAQFLRSGSNDLGPLA